MSAAAISSGVASTRATVWSMTADLGDQRVGGPDFRSHAAQQLGDPDGGDSRASPVFFL